MADVLIEEIDKSVFLGIPVVYIESNKGRYIMETEKLIACLPQGLNIDSLVGKWVSVKENGGERRSYRTINELKLCEEV